MLKTTINKVENVLHKKRYYFLQNPINRIPECINLNNSLSQSLFTDNSLFIDNNSFIIDFSKLTLFNFERAFGWSDAMVIVKLRTMRLLVPPDDPELYKCPNCCNDLRRVEEKDYALGYRYRCKDKLRSGTVNPANTWFSCLRATEKNLNPLLRSLKICFSYLCGIGVGISAETMESNPKTAWKIIRLVRYISSNHLKSTT